MLEQFYLNDLGMEVQKQMEIGNIWSGQWKFTQSTLERFY